MRKITSLVISLHLVFIAFLMLNRHPSSPYKTKHIQVHTIQPVAVVKASTSRSSSPLPRPTSPPVSAKKNASQPKKTAPSKTPPPSVPKTPASAKQPSVSPKPTIQEKKKSPSQKPSKPADNSAQLWEEIDQALAKIEKKSYPIPKQTLDLLQPALLPDTIIGEKEAEEDRNTFMEFLHESLHLPEVGEVKVEISLKQDGSVSKVVILQAESKKNALYLQEHLPRLHFPRVIDYDKTWIITFCNEI